MCTKMWVAIQRNNPELVQAFAVLGVTQIINFTISLHYLSLIDRLIPRSKLIDELKNLLKLANPSHRQSGITRKNIIMHSWPKFVNLSVTFRSNGRQSLIINLVMQVEPSVVADMHCTLEQEASSSYKWTLATSVRAYMMWSPRDTYSNP